MNISIFYIILILLVGKRNYINIKRPIFFNVVCVLELVLIVSVMLGYFVDNRWIAIKVHSFVDISFALIPVFRSLHIRQQTSTKKISKEFITVILIIPIITCILALSDDIFHLIHTRLYYTKNVSSYLNIVQYGFWYYVHITYSYALNIISLLTLLKIYFLMPVTIRKPVFFMLIATCLITVANIVTLLGIIKTDFEWIIVVNVIYSWIFYKVLSKTDTSQIIITSREKIYNNLAVKIFVLNLDEVIVDCNSNAYELCKQLDITPIGVKYEYLKKSWLEMKEGRTSMYDKNVVTVVNNNIESHFHINKQHVTIDMTQLGYYVEIQEITQLYTLFRYIEESAFYDQLTGVRNRNSYLNTLEEWNTEEYLPLGIIIGDINRLKYVNDTYGHIVGDNMLIDIANIIKSSTPKQAMIARIGGDEFVILIPRSSINECEQVIDKVKLRCSEIINDYGSPSIALGYTIRTNIRQDIAELVKQADIEMYKNKYDRRKN